MIARALRGLEGLTLGRDGACTLALDAKPVPVAASTSELSFVRRLQPGTFAKAQLAGPVTVGRFTRTPSGAPIGDVPDLMERVVDHLAAKAALLARTLRLANVTPIIFIDEPGLGTGPGPSAWLERVRRAAKDEGAMLGVHCCAQTPWAPVLDLGFDVVSLDARLSLDALLEDRSAWLGFLERGGTLCLGIIPTNPEARYDVGELCDSVEASLRATTPHFARVLGRMMVSPACGLGLHSIEGAQRVTREVKEAQVRLRSLL